MGEVNIPEKNLDEALTSVIESIALGESAIANLINVEADKVNRALNAGMCLEDLKCIHKQVESIMKAAVKKEMLLQFKIENIKELLDK